MRVLTVAASCRPPFCCVRWAIESEEILEMFYETTSFQLQRRDTATMTLVPNAYRATWPRLIFMVGNKVIVELVVVLLRGTFVS